MLMEVLDIDIKPRGIKGFIDSLSKLQLEGKKFAVFDIYIWEKTSKSCEKDGGTNKRNGSRIKTDSFWFIDKSSRNERFHFRRRTSKMQKNLEKDSNST